MTEYEVIPHVGVGPAKLGALRIEVRAAMPGEPSSFSKGLEPDHETDAWHNSAFQVFYTGDPPRAEYIELSGGCDIRAFYKRMSVFDTPADEAVAMVERDAPYDRNNPELGYSYSFPALDLCLWREIIPDSPDTEYGLAFCTIGIGVKGYCSKLSV